MVKGGGVGGRSCSGAHANRCGVTWRCRVRRGVASSRGDALWQRRGAVPGGRAVREPAIAARPADRDREQLPECGDACCRGLRDARAARQYGQRGARIHCRWRSEPGRPNTPRLSENWSVTMGSTRCWSPTSTVTAATRRQSWKRSQPPRSRGPSRLWRPSSASTGGCRHERDRCAEFPVPESCAAALARAAQRHAWLAARRTACLSRSGSPGSTRGDRLVAQAQAGRRLAVARRGRSAARQPRNPVRRLAPLPRHRQRGGGGS